MAHFAKLDENNKVISVVCVKNEIAIDEKSGIKFLKELYKDDSNWIQCSYNSTIRNNYPGIGYTYRPDIDAFISPQPFPSWNLDDNLEWAPPIPMPDDGNIYIWDESKLSWIIIQE